MNLQSAFRKLRRRQTIILLIIVMCWYGIATLPYLGDFPPLEWAQMGLAAPAYKLAQQNIYGNDLFTGFYRTETLNYEYMPLYPLTVAAAFKLFGLGVVQARLVSVVLGLITVLLTYWLGQQLYDSAVGLVAAAALCVLRLGIEPANMPFPRDIVYASGIPLLDIARIVRYDIAVPVWVLASCICFYSAETQTHRARLRYFVAGIFAGLATLSHVYGALILIVLDIVMIVQHGASALRRSAIYLIALGWLTALLPWLIYILQDTTAFFGQMLRHESRFDFLNPAFYSNNVMREPSRYLRWIGGSIRHPILFPRVGIWLLVVGVAAANALLLKRIRAQRQLSDRLLFTALPVLALGLAMFVDLKRYPYVVLILPFLALQLGLVVVTAWRWAAKRSMSARRLIQGVIGLVLVAAIIEGGVGVAGSIRQAHATTPYDQVTQEITRAIPSRSRLLISQTYWLGLADFDVRSINLAFVLSDPRYRHTHQLTMEQAIQQIDPDYIVVEDYFLKLPAGSTTPRVMAQWQALMAYMGNHCADIVTTVPTQDYGIIRVYRCKRE